MAEAHRRVLVETVRSHTDLPGFDNSAMDGYAVQAADTVEAKPGAPIALEVLGRVAAGEVFAKPVRSRMCVRLFTGSPLPAGADSVVMQEDTQPDQGNQNRILVLEPVRCGENVRFRGEDVVKGATLANAGQIVNAGLLSLLAATGVERVAVGRQPTVGLISTGSELMEPGRPLESGQIYESNRLGLAALMRQVGAKPNLFPLVKDTLTATEQALSEAFQGCDLVVSTGGASVGELDLVRAALEHLGGKIEFWKVAIKPGRPFVFGQMAGRLFFGLPGNPISALVSFLLLVRPALLRWQGAPEVDLPGAWGTLSEALSNPGSRRHFVRVNVDSKGTVTLAGEQASHMLGSMGKTNGLVDLAPGAVIPAGSPVLVRTWDG